MPGLTRWLTTARAAMRAVDVEQLDPVVVLDAGALRVVLRLSQTTGPPRFSVSMSRLSL